MVKVEHQGNILIGYVYYQDNKQYFISTVLETPILLSDLTILEEI